MNHDETMHALAKLNQSSHQMVHQARILKEPFSIVLYTNTQTHTRAHPHTRARTHTSTSRNCAPGTHSQSPHYSLIHKHTTTHAHTNTQTHKHTNTQTRTHAHTHTQTHTHTRMCAFRTFSKYTSFFPQTARLCDLQTRNSSIHKHANTQTHKHTRMSAFRTFIQVSFVY